MTPKEKAEDLIAIYWNAKVETPHVRESIMSKELAKQCALIAVDFAMNSKYSFQPMHGGWVSGKLHYEELKQEIEKL